MKKFYSLLLMVLPAFAAFCQCTPDPSLNKPGISPTKLPNGVVGSAYEQVISLMVPLDTAIDYQGTLINARVDSATVIYLSDFPSGFNYVCDKASKTWKGGEKGCAKLYGTAVETNRGDYHIWVKTHTFFKIVGLPDQYSRIDSSAIDFSINWPNGISEARGVLPLQFFPNPSSNLVTIIPARYNAAATYKVIDLLGKEMGLNPEFSSNTGEVKINTSALAPGVYLIKAESEGQLFQSKFIKE